MGSVVISDDEAGLAPDRALTDGPSAGDPNPAETPALAPVVAAMGELRAAIDTFLGDAVPPGVAPTPAATTPAGPGAATPVLLRKSLTAGGQVLAGPLVGFCCGTATAAVLSLVLTVRTARRADWAVYSAM